MHEDLGEWYVARAILIVVQEIPQHFRSVSVRVNGTCAQHGKGVRRHPRESVMVEVITAINAFANYPNAPLPLRYVERMILWQATAAGAPPKGPEALPAPRDVQTPRRIIRRIVLSGYENDA